MEILHSLLQAVAEFIAKSLQALWPSLVGYFFAVVIAHFFIKPVVAVFWDHISEGHKRQDIRPNPLLPEIVGGVERILYVASLQMGKPEFIGVWLALKVAGQWKRWSEGVNNITGRGFYNTFLIGSAMSVLYALTGARMIEWLSLKTDHLSEAIFVPVVLMLSSIALGIWVKRKDTKLKR